MNPLAIGINEYANARPKLKFAVSDADDFSDTLRDDQVTARSSVSAQEIFYGRIKPLVHTAF